ncbi:hypothetical protein PILCRDRAFT_727122 [Piloderma croceum F 1598]|uniref:Uncharacterized protein n=1 Tax=Piloderma croceum (strain F 1598) TaxID=765440 RepID=A0A0C3B821_PILCF|nr:hypothetical protein PILCRDRAFT_727122 [Piloderma croceum F 1598]
MPSATCQPVRDLCQVKRVAREMGTEDKLGIQPKVGNVQSIWQEITLSVNAMAGNFVQGFAQIPAATMDGDLTRFITIEASGWIRSIRRSTRWFSICAIASRRTPRRRSGQNWRIGARVSSWRICLTTVLSSRLGAMCADVVCFIQDTYEWDYRHDIVDTGQQSESLSEGKPAFGS